MSRWGSAVSVAGRVAAERAVAGSVAAKPGDEPRGARNRAVGGRLALGKKVRAYGVHHLQAFFHSLGGMVRSPLSSLMTVAVIGIALALPTGLHVILKNAQGVSSGWENAAQISLFLNTGISAAEVAQLSGELQAMTQVATVTHVSPAQALEEFRRLSGFGDAIDALDENPLPVVLVVQPKVEFSGPAQVESLLGWLRELPRVDMAQLDMEWIKRLYAIMEIGKRGVVVLAALLALAVLLVVGNTIRLAVQNRRDEIEVQKLIGATDGFIRRPFLYSGFWHGLLGAVVAWLLVHASLWLLQGPVRRLSLLYESEFEMGGLGSGPSAALVLAGVLLGLVGAWLAVGRHLRDIEPT